MIGTNCKPIQWYYIIPGAKIEDAALELALICIRTRAVVKADFNGYTIRFLPNITAKEHVREVNSVVDAYYKWDGKK